MPRPRVDSSVIETEDWVKAEEMADELETQRDAPDDNDAEFHFQAIKNAMELGNLRQSGQEPMAFFRVWRQLSEICGDPTDNKRAALGFFVRLDEWLRDWYMNRAGLDKYQSPLAIAQLVQIRWEIGESSITRPSKRSVGNQDSTHSPRPSKAARPTTTPGDHRPAYTKSEPSLDTPRFCYNCDGEGHILRDCRQPRNKARIRQILAELQDLLAEYEEGYN